MPDAIVEVGEEGARFRFDHGNLGSLAGKCLDRVEGVPERSARNST
jgi:hypothetical protein